MTNSAPSLIPDGQRSVTNGRWKIIRYPLIDKTQLFDLQNDPYEIQNLAYIPEYEPTLKALQAELKAFQQRTRDPWITKYEYE